MTPKEKAFELLKSMYGNIFDGGQYEDSEDSWYRSKQCALIAVDEILKSNEDWDLEQNIWCDTGFFGDCQMYWIEVKQEIQNL